MNIFKVATIISIAILILGFSLNLNAVYAHHDDNNPTPTPTSTPTPTPTTLKVTLCHYDNGQGGKYTSNTVSINSVSDCQDAGGHGNHQDDIIPPYTYQTCSYPGKNWDSIHQAIYNNNCNFPTVTPTSTPTPTITVTPTVTPTPTTAPVTPTVTPTSTPSITPSITPTPTSTPPNGGGSTQNPPSVSDGRSDGLSSCPSCTQASQIQAVLGASTMAGTGTFIENMMNTMAVIGMIVLTLGGLSYAKERNK